MEMHVLLIVMVFVMVAVSVTGRGLPIPPTIRSGVTHKPTADASPRLRRLVILVVDLQWPTMEGHTSLALKFLIKTSTSRLIFLEDPWNTMSILAKLAVPAMQLFT